MGNYLEKINAIPSESECVDIITATDYINRVFDVMGKVDSAGKLAISSVVSKIVSNGWLIGTEYSNVIQYLQKACGVKQSQAYAYKKVSEVFMNESGELSDSRFEGFNFSALDKLSHYNKASCIAAIEAKVIKPTMSNKDIERNVKTIDEEFKKQEAINLIASDNPEMSFEEAADTYFQTQLDCEPGTSRELDGRDFPESEWYLDRDSIRQILPRISDKITNDSERELVFRIPVYLGWEYPDYQTRVTFCDNGIAVIFGVNTINGDTYTVRMLKDENAFDVDGLDLFNE